MNKQTQHFLMQCLYKFSKHFGIETHTDYTFENRKELMIRLKSIDRNAYSLMDQFIAHQISLNESRINKAQRKKDFISWIQEYDLLNHQSRNSGKALINYCNENNIPLINIIRKLID